MDIKFFKVGNSYHLREVSNIEDPLQPAIYMVAQDPISGEVYIDKTSEDFYIGHKIYGMETQFINRVKKTYEETTGNLGILLNGVKGTGKTVTSKLICNNMGLPVLVVPAAFKPLPDFLSKVPHDIVVVFDEFEKMYPASHSNNADILTVMEGVLSNEYRRIFILTTNSLYINDNLLERPGRIRYQKEYKDLPLVVIEEVVDDLLIHKELRNDCIDFISTLKTITIDIIKKIIEEVNIHHDSPKMFGEYFNVKKTSKTYDLFKIDTNGKESIWYEDVTITPIQPLKPGQKQALRVEGDWEANIISILGPNLIVVDEEMQDEGADPVHFTVRIVDRMTKHASFRVF